MVLANFNHACPEPHFEAHCKLCLEQMEGVIGSYAGEFLRGFSLPDCPDFEEWVQIQREGLHLRILAILARLAECNARTGAYAKALRPALRYLELDLLPGKRAGTEAGAWGVALGRDRGAGREN